jgi:hypothetical protein
MIFLGYVKFSSCLFLIGTLTVYDRLPLYSNLLISGGRDERFLATTAIVVINTIVITLYCMTVAVFSVLIKDVMPSIYLFGEKFVFQEADIRLFFVSILIIPIASMFNLIFYRKQMIIMILNMLMCSLLIFIGFLISANLESSYNNRFEIILPKPEIVIAIIFFSWSLFLAVLKYICERKSLV